VQGIWTRKIECAKIIYSTKKKIRPRDLLKKKKGPSPIAEEKKKPPRSERSSLLIRKHVRVVTIAIKKERGGVKPGFFEDKKRPKAHKKGNGVQFPSPPRKKNRWSFTGEGRP